MGLFYRTTDKVVEQKAQIEELEDKDREWGKKLLDIEQKFGDVKTSTEELTTELHKAIQSAKEGSDMMKIMVDRYDEAQAKIKTLEAEKSTLVADNSALDTQIMEAFEKATLKARYDLLKEYKQGLLVDVDVDEEIELYEDTLDEARASSSVLAATSKEHGSPNVEPPVLISPSEDHETRK